MLAGFDQAEMHTLLAATLDELSLPVLLHDDNRVLFANAAARQLLGPATPSEIEGLCLDAFLVAELAHVTVERRGYLLHSHMVFTDLPIMMLALDGRTIHLRVDARPLTVGDRTVGLVTLAR